MTPPKDAPAASWPFAANRTANRMVSLPQAHASIKVERAWWRRLLAFAGPGYLVSVGYMDPGNWATDILGGSGFGYTLLSVIFMSNLMAMILQTLAIRLGVATERDLAQACRDACPPYVRALLWALCELAIIACDIAEVLGAAIALNLLFALPLACGAALSALDAVVSLALMRLGFRYLESYVFALLIVIAACFFIETAAAAPAAGKMLRGLLPGPSIVANPDMLVVAMGILGATVMPHNLYLHSSLVQTRAYDRSHRGKCDAIRWATLDSLLALTFALFVNAAILVLAAAAFHDHGLTQVSDLTLAHKLLTPLLGATLASILFAVALLASGMGSSVTATLAGQIVMEGFMNWRIPSWIRRLTTRGLAIAPVMAAVLLFGGHGTAGLMLVSQVALSMQLPFAVIPLVLFVSDRRKMGKLVTPVWLTCLAWITATITVALNVKILADLIIRSHPI